MKPPAREKRTGRGRAGRPDEASRTCLDNRSSPLSSPPAIAGSSRATGRPRSTIKTGEPLLRLSISELRLFFASVMLAFLMQLKLPVCTRQSSQMTRRSPRPKLHYANEFLSGGATNDCGEPSSCPIPQERNSPTGGGWRRVVNTYRFGGPPGDVAKGRRARLRGSPREGPESAPNPSFRKDQCQYSRLSPSGRDRMSPRFAFRKG